LHLQHLLVKRGIKTCNGFVNGVPVGVRIGGVRTSRDK
jgi:hypothetical protein